MRNVLRKALPGGLTDFLLVFCAQGFGHAFDIPSDMVGTICTLVILCVGLQILWGVCIPFTPLHWAIWGSMTVAGVGGVFLLARWLPLVRLDLGGTLVLVVLLALSAPTLPGLSLWASGCMAWSTIGKIKKNENAYKMTAPPAEKRVGLSFYQNNCNRGIMRNGNRREGS